MIDTHTHLNFKAFEADWQDVVKRAIENGVEKMIVVGTDLASSKRAAEMAEQDRALYASVGIHPHHARKFSITNNQFPNKFQIQNSKLQNEIRELKELAKHPRVVAIGEVGLDYHVYKNSKYPSTALRTSSRLIELQKELLKLQVRLAQELDKPLIIHSREVKDEVLETIVKVNPKSRGVFHCFEGPKKYLIKILDAGFYVGFDGNITYSHDRAEVAKEVPMERLLLETDCPFMLPEPMRSLRKKEGKKLRSEPKDVKIIGQFHAKSRGIYLNEVESQTNKNVKVLFNL